MRLLNVHTRLEGVTLQDWQSLSVAELELKEGCRKIDYCCKRTLKDDNTSSAELSEAINSMFRCRWFTRGWTLQELLAFRDIVFFLKNWQNLTTKLKSVEILSTTGIKKGYLEGNPIKDASAAKRISWAAARETTRIEDIAYCLLGIFNVNMPQMRR
ncbi:hypothetical protein F4823DRAFT_629407 [Ustulina deusta]|nr:hypothetical protein F4823DRAFT_629407 [Ustulina deusta]